MAASIEMANPLLDEQPSKTFHMPHMPLGIYGRKEQEKRISCRLLNDSAAADLTTQTQVINSRVWHLVNFKCLLAQFTISQMAKGKVHKDAPEPEPESSSPRT